MLRKVARLRRLTRAQFESRFRLREPFVVEGCMRTLARRWTMAHLKRVAGDALVDVARYRAARGNYNHVELSRMKLHAFLELLGHDDETRYLFNNPSCVFARNESRADLHSGWASRVNPGLASLGDVPLVPTFLRAEDYVLATLILGSAQNSTDMHYDWGGESKLLIQVQGRKRIRLGPPPVAPLLGLPNMYSGAQRGSSPALATKRLSALSSRRRRLFWEAELHPGDVIYWPSFWFHEVKNLDTPTLAVGLFLDEIQLSALVVRHLLARTFHAFVSILEQGRGRHDLAPVRVARTPVSAGESPPMPLSELFLAYEQFLMSRCSDVQNLWTWNTTVPWAKCEP